ncbi:hypothetical protein ACSDVA_001268 [Listeria monocytogenes]|uniref:hypothetical protein n=1 Tax=Listeria monocytogenes TaxID=1639 RepID=UPI000D73797D|nr:hypothetical protein [Listeria monocytogenes]EAF4583658.1 hypothetical protein [Listeria monocytogenes serotype 1/2a]EAC4704706.1 hypothetical protein [Listeria monocytogenes]EAF4482809.1 hypothetical protein [Listeria monocytogenes]EHC5243886.1 hypothetical protein [Listeria monocytogenes serotype 1/2a]EHD1707562.1 hypothetical protein [Listeria monocytogenes]
MTVQTKSVNTEMQQLGFIVGIPYYVFTKQISRYTLLVVEGTKVKGYAEIRYSFYKATYDPRHRGKPSRVKIYLKDESVVAAIRSIQRFISHFNNPKEVKIYHSKKQIK